MSSRTVRAGRWFRGKMADAGFVPPVAPSAAITDATPVSDPATSAEINAVVTKFNSLLAAARTHGIIAE